MPSRDHETRRVDPTPGRAPGLELSRRGLLAGLPAVALAACERIDAMSWVTRERFDVDRRFVESTEELPWPVPPRLERGEPWSMLVVSDFHSWGEVPTTIGDIRRYLEGAPVDLLFALGDLADAGLPEEHEATRAGLDSLGPPVFTAFGNHDSYHEGWAAYRDIDGPSVYELRVAGSSLIVLDSAGATLGGLQRPWLEVRLEAAAEAEHRFVLGHYPLWTGRLDLGDMMASEQEVYDLLDLFRRHHVEGFFSGHTHRWAHTALDDLELYTVSSMREEAADRTGLRVEVDGASVRYERVDLS